MFLLASGAFHPGDENPDHGKLDLERDTNLRAPFDDHEAPDHGARFCGRRAPTRGRVREGGVPASVPRANSRRFDQKFQYLVGESPWQQAAAAERSPDDAAGVAAATPINDAANDEGDGDDSDGDGADREDGGSTNTSRNAEQRKNDANAPRKGTRPLLRTGPLLPARDDSARAAAPSSRKRPAPTAQRGQRPPAAYYNDAGNLTYAEHCCSEGAAGKPHSAICNRRSGGSSSCPGGDDDTPAVAPHSAAPPAIATSSAHPRTPVIHDAAPRAPPLGTSHTHPPPPTSPHG